MRNHDTALALVLVTVAVVWWAASAVGKWRQKRRIARRLRDIRQQQDRAAGPITDWYLFNRDDFTAIMRNPNAPVRVKLLAASIAHQRGWCDCAEVFDQQAAHVGDEAEAWLASRSDAS